MFLQRSAATVSRRATVSPLLRRAITGTAIRRDAAPSTPDKKAATPAEAPKMKTLKDIQTIDDLIGPGAKVGTVPTDLEQATGLERLEILGKMEGVDIFDMRPLDSSRVGTMEDPIMVRSAGEEQWAGCTGCPADSHVVIWLGMSRERPIERCPECGSVYKMNYVGKPHDPHDHHHHEPEYPEPKSMADYIKPEYYYR